MKNGTRGTATLRGPRRLVIGGSCAPAISRRSRPAIGGLGREAYEGRAPRDPAPAHGRRGRDPRRPVGGGARQAGARRARPGGDGPGAAPPVRAGAAGVAGLHGTAAAVRLRKNNLPPLLL